MYKNVISCQLFLLRLYAIKVVVAAYSLLTYNIDIFQIVFQRISLLTFSKTFLSNMTKDSILRQDCP